VVLEAVFTLERHYGQSMERVADLLLPLLDLPGIKLPGTPAVRLAFERYVLLNLSFADAYHSVVCGGSIVSFDRGLDRVPGVKRVEP
jgi:uncharacterized protein